MGSDSSHAARPQRATRLVVRAEEAKVAPKKEVGPKRGSLVGGSSCTPLWKPVGSH